jgi:hypothetical protein
LRLRFEEKIMSRRIDRTPRVLRDWYSFRRFSSDCGEVREYLVGAVYGDSVEENGTVVVTSAIRYRTHDVAVSELGARYVLEAEGLAPVPN